MEGLKKTPLYDLHVKYGGRIIDFEGWALPVQFTSIIEEHHAVRERAGLFDVSDMGELEVTGKDALPLLEKALTNVISGMVDGQIRYSPMCYENGGVVDDLLVYRDCENHYMLVINAANIEKDFRWLSDISRDFPHARVTDISDDVAEVALQGPLSQGILQSLVEEDLNDIGYYYFKDRVSIAGMCCLVSRTGYTGEDGFEIYCQPGDAPGLWEALMDRGKPLGLAPAGLGSRDTLRFEAALPLYGQEMADNISPLEAGLHRFVRLEKDFIGRDALAAQKEEGLKRVLVGFAMKDRGVPRTGYPIVSDGKEIGHVSTGSFAPSLGVNIGLGFVPPQLSQPGQELVIRVRNRELRAEVVRKPFYRRSKEA